MDHNPSNSFVTCEDGTLIEAAVVLDATGHSRRLVKYDKPFNPGYQIAYGIVAEVCNIPSFTRGIVCYYFGDAGYGCFRSINSQRQESIHSLYLCLFQSENLAMRRLGLDWAL